MPAAEQIPDSEPGKRAGFTVNLSKIPPWAYLLFGIAGGGASGTALARPVISFGVSRDEVEEVVKASTISHEQVAEIARSVSITTEDVRAVVKEELEQRDRYLLQEIRLVVAEAKLGTRSARSIPMLSAEEAP